MASAYAEGDGVPADHATALAWARAASARDSALGHHMLAWHFRDGKAVTKQTSRYVALMRAAIAGGSVQAMLELAQLPPSRENHAVYPKVAEQQSWLNQAAADRLPGAAALQQAHSLNHKISQGLVGMAVQREGYGLIGESIARARPLQPCTTSISTATGKAWSIDWSASVAHRAPPGADLEIRGKVLTGTPFAFTGGIVASANKLTIRWRGYPAGTSAQAEWALIDTHNDAMKLTAVCRGL